MTAAHTPIHEPSPGRGARILRHAAVVWVVGAFALWLDVTRPAGGATDQAEKLAVRAGAFERVEDYTLSADELRMLGTDDAIARRYADAEGAVFVYAVFHDTDWKSVHPPRTCLEGSNMQVLEDDVRRISSDGPAVGRLVCWSVDRERRYVSLYAYVAPPDRVRASYWDFVFDAIPRAMLRRSNAGALIRVETWVDGDDLQSAQLRCGRFLTAILPEVFACFR